MNWIAKLPWRKPLAVFSVIFTLVLIVVAYKTGNDIPSGVVSVLIALNGIIVGGYFGSSAYEAVRAPREEFPPPPEEKEGSE